MTNQFPAIVRGFVQGTRPQADGQWNTMELFQTAAAQNLLLVLAYENKLWKLFDDEAASKKLESLLYNSVAGNLNRCVDFESLSKKLTEQGIAHMPVKGYYLRQLYAVPELRTFGDIDILIHPEDRRKTHELMLTLGYTVKQDWEPSYAYVKNNEYYEIHTNLMDGNLDGRADLQAYFDKAWLHAEADNGERYRPGLNFHFIYIVCHLAKHLYGGGAGLRMYLDVALYVKRYDAELNWAEIENEFAGLGLSDFFHTVMNACKSWFSVETVCPLPEPDADALDSLLEYTLDSDLFGHLRDHSVVNLRNADGGKKSKTKLMLNMLFPSAESIESRYTFLQGRHWLLPAAWVARLFANVRLIPKRIRNLRGVKNADAGEVDSYDAFMKKLGL